jgi:hypothetical protein
MAREDARGPDTSEATVLSVEENNRRDPMASPNPGIKSEVTYMAPEIKRKAKIA